MPTSFVSRKHLSELEAAKSRIGTEGAINYHYALVDVKGSTTIEPIGTPVVWNNTDAFTPYIAQDVTALTTDSTLPNEAPVAVTVGTYEYVGANEADVTLTTTATKMWVMFRGPAGVKEEGIEWNAGSNAAAQAAFRVLMEKAGVAVVASASLAAPTFG